MKVLIIDSGWNTYHILTPLIKEYIQDVEEVDLANGSMSAVTLIHEKKYNLVFLAGHCAGVCTQYIMEEIHKEKQMAAVIVYGKNFTLQEYNSFIASHIFGLLDVPFQSEQIKKVLADYVDIWSRRREQLMLEREKLRKQAGELVEYSFLCSVLLRGGVEIDWKRYQYLLDITGIGYAMVINVVKEITTEKVYTQYECYAKMIRECIPSGYKAIIGRFNGRRILVFVMKQYGLMAEHHISKREQVRASLELKKIFMDKYKESVQIGVGREKAIDLLYLSYEEAIKGLDQSDEMADISLEKQEKKEETYETLERQFYELVMEGSQGAIEILTVLYSMIQENELTELKNKVMEIFSVSSHIAKKYGHQKGKCISYMQLGRQLDQMQREEIGPWLLRSVSYIIHTVSDNQGNTSFSDMKKVTNYISVHFDEDISLESAASILNLSPQYFSRVFKEQMKLTFIDYLTSIRVQKAKEWLRYSNNTIQEICYKVGYKDPNYFTRVFKKVTGVTPRQYKVREIR